jgi:hypothetical protein
MFTVSQNRPDSTKKSRRRVAKSTYSEEIDVLKLPYAVSQSFLSVFPYRSVETMDTAEVLPSTG